MTGRGMAFLAAGGSAALLAAAHIFEAFGWEPCAMCLWQRWPHWAAIGAGGLALLIPLAIAALLGAIASATTAGIAVYHTGVERKWWDGPASCTTPGDALTGLSGADLLSVDGPALVLCDQFTPFLLGLSMANWNALISLGLFAIWSVALGKGRG